MSTPLAGLLGGGCSIVLGAVMGVWFRALAQAGDYMPGPLYFVVIPYALALLAGLIMELFYRPAFRFPKESPAFCLGLVFPLGVVLEICNAFRLGPGNGEPYAGVFFWLSNIAVYALLGAGFGIGLSEVAESRRRHEGETRRLREIDRRLLTVEDEIRRRERELGATASIRSAHDELAESVDELVRTDPANLEAAQRQMASRLRGLGARELGERLRDLSNDLKTRQRKQEELAGRMQDAEHSLSQKVAQLRAAERDLAAAASDDQANTRVVVDRLKVAWDCMTLEELAQQAAPGVIAPLYKALRTAELQIEGAAQTSELVRSELKVAVAATLSVRLELLVCRRECLVREGGSEADPEEIRRHLRVLEEESEALRSEGDALRTVISRGVISS